MKLNENIAIATPQVLLVPYDARHVARYHEWMQDPAVREATASDPLTLAEERANQRSWRAAPDKLTFILCQPLPPLSAGGARPAALGVEAGTADAPARMVGDVNLFLHATASTTGAGAHVVVVDAEVDIMIAAPRHRRAGAGRAAVAALLGWALGAERERLLAEYDAGEGGAREGTRRRSELGVVMAKIGAGNAGSLALFRGLGFVQEGDGPDYFGEVRLVLDADVVRDGAGGTFGAEEAAWRVLEYRRAALEG